MILMKTIQANQYQYFAVIKPVISGSSKKCD